MKAVVTTQYGPPEVLKLQEIDKPEIKDDEILIKMKAATVTGGDCELRRFDIPLPIIFWLPLRIIMGITKPRNNLVQGQEMAGEVVEVGKDVREWKPGDSVYGGAGMGFGAYAEYKKHKASYPIVNKPGDVAYEDAVTLVVGGINALHFLRKAKIKPGEKVLVYGSTGSIGNYALQLAKYYGAEVTAVCTTQSVDLMKSLGADHIIDWQKEDYTKRNEMYDIIFEAVGKSSFSRGIKCLNENGRYILSNPKFLQMLRGALINIIGKNKVIFQFAAENKEDLKTLADLMEKGAIKAVIDQKYQLEQVAEGHRYVENEHKVGHVVIKFEDEA